MVVRIGFFATAGWTEAGGLQSFLRKLRPEDEWVRCFPAVRKPAPKWGRMGAAPASRHAGRTGEALVDAMIEILIAFHSGEQCQFDAIVLVDDADCRFSGPDAFDGWVDGVARRVHEATQRVLPVFILLAAPEIEAWIVADWPESFAREYGGVAVSLRRHLDSCLLRGLDPIAIEQYGGRRLDNGCERKLSRDLDRAFSENGCQCGARGDLVECGRRYRKSVEGVAMLKRIRPDVVREACPTYFGPGFDGLRRWN